MITDSIYVSRRGYKRQRKLGKAMQSQRKEESLENTGNRVLEADAEDLGPLVHKQSEAPAEIKSLRSCGKAS